jgi:hypothetical protein
MMRLISIMIHIVNCLTLTFYSKSSKAFMYNIILIFFCTFAQFHTSKLKLVLAEFIFSASELKLFLPNSYLVNEVGKIIM